METKELKIQIPEGYCVDESKSTFEKIVFKKKENTKPRSWEEYCHTQLNSEETRIGYTIGNNCVIYTADWDNGYNACNCSTWRNVLPTKELAEAFIAMMQLMSLRQAWIGDWKPDWKESSRKYGIVNDMNNIVVISYYYISISLSFPTEKMAKDFVNCFSDLLEVAKPLI